MGNHPEDQGPVDFVPSRTDPLTNPADARTPVQSVLDALSKALSDSVAQIGVGAPVDRAANVARATFFARCTVVFMSRLTLPTAFLWVAKSAPAGLRLFGGATSPWICATPPPSGETAAIVHLAPRAQSRGLSVKTAVSRWPAQTRISVGFALKCTPAAINPHPLAHCTMALESSVTGARSTKRSGLIVNAAWLHIVCSMPGPTAPCIPDCREWARWVVACCAHCGAPAAIRAAGVSLARCLDSHPRY